MGGLGFLFLFLFFLLVFFCFVLFSKTEMAQDYWFI